GAVRDITELAAVAPPWLIVALPALGGLVVAPLVLRWAREARGHGVPEVMGAIARSGARIRPRVSLVKAAASVVTIGTGGSVGWEGPIVQIGAGVGSSAGQWLGVARRQMRVLVACGAAAGIAATFNAPIAGVLFSVEILLGDLALATFTPIVVSSVAATAVSYYTFAEHAVFDIPDQTYRLQSLGELPLCVLLGLLAAAGAVGFTRVLYGFEDRMERLPVPPLLLPALGGLAVGGIGLLAPEALGVGYGTIGRSLDGEFTLGLLAVIFLLKTAATCCSIGSGGSGGVFAPSLVLGALLGGAFGDVVHRLLPDATAIPGVYAVVGMAAFVAGTTHAPMTAILILFEMTNDYLMILPLMLACVISSVTARGLYRDSIYTLKLTRRGIQFRGGRDVALLRSLSVRDTMRRSPTVLTLDLPFQEVRARAVQGARQQVFPVLDRSERVGGVVTLDTLRPFLLEEALVGVAVARDLEIALPELLGPEDDLQYAEELFSKSGLDELPVVEAESRRLLGLLRQRDVRAAYNKAVALAE
ncbi:MAG: chloride channel protein, partial [Planctomycetota bacterium]